MKRVNANRLLSLQQKQQEERRQLTRKIRSEQKARSQVFRLSVRLSTASGTGLSAAEQERMQVLYFIGHLRLILIVSCLLKLLQWVVETIYVKCIFQIWHNQCLLCKFEFSLVLSPRQLLNITTIVVVISSRQPLSTQPFCADQMLIFCKRVLQFYTVEDSFLLGYPLLQGLNCIDCFLLVYLLLSCYTS